MGTVTVRILGTDVDVSPDDFLKISRLDGNGETRVLLEIVGKGEFNLSMAEYDAFAEQLSKALEIHYAENFKLEAE